MEPAFDPIRCDDSGAHRRNCPCPCHHGASHPTLADTCARAYAHECERLDRAGREYALTGLGDEGRRQRRIDLS